MSETKKDKLVYLLIGLIATAFFCIIYGVKVLNPQYVEWLMAGIDLPQHYLGWVAYRNSPWTFPLGLGNQLSYPADMSVVFSDSVPLLALIFKVMSPILPRTFQYTGWVGLLSFIMQGVLAARIFRHYSDNRIAIIVMSIFFSLSPIALYRMYSQVTLTFCWILLIGIEMLLCYDKYSSGVKVFGIILILGILSGGTQLYFILMNGIIVFGICVIDMIENKRVLRSALYLSDFVISAGFVVWIMGGFSIKNSGSAPGLGIYSFNLNGFVNPMGWSSILPDLNVHAPEQVYGFAYYGMGLLILILIATAIVLRQHKLKYLWTTYKAQIIASIIVGTISLIIAASPKVTLFGAILVMYELPKKLMELWGIFRTTQRVIWVLWYLIAIVAGIVILKYMKREVVCYFLLFLLILQIYDIHIPLQEIHSLYANESSYVDPMQDKIWDDIVQDDDIQHVVCSSYFDLNKMYPLADWALKNNLTYNIFYFARAIDFDQEGYAERLMLNPTTDNVYVFDESEADKCELYDLNYKYADGLIIGRVK